MNGFSGTDSEPSLSLDDLVWSWRLRIGLERPGVVVNVNGSVLGSSLRSGYQGLQVLSWIERSWGHFKCPWMSKDVLG